MSNPNENNNRKSEQDDLDLEHVTIVDLDPEEQEGREVRGGCITTNTPRCAITGGA